MRGFLSAHMSKLFSYLDLLFDKSVFKTLTLCYLINFWSVSVWHAHAHVLAWNGAFPESLAILLAFQVLINLFYPLKRQAHAAAFICLVFTPTQLTIPLNHRRVINRTLGSRRCLRGTSNHLRSGKLCNRNIIVPFCWVIGRQGVTNIVWWRYPICEKLLHMTIHMLRTLVPLGVP